MDLPNNVKYLLEALRGGGQSRFHNGVEVEHNYGPAPKTESTQKMPKSMDMFHQARLEAMVNGTPPPTYQEWMANQ